MAVIWQKKIDAQHYEIRTAGKSRRLYKNGVCHSQFNPGNIITGSIWDLLILPSCYQPDVHPARVLLLGVGGGAVIRQLHSLFCPESITGVEKDALHIDLGRRFFGLDMDSLELVEADAVDWLRRHRKHRYELIIEDMFSESSRRPVRAVPADGEWLKCLTRHLSGSGILVMNFASEEEFRESAVCQDMKLRNRFTSIYRLTLPTLDNVVVAMHKRAVDHKGIHRNIMHNPVLERAVMSRKLKYRIRKLRQLKHG
ncbi:MAG: histidine kinase [Gammaproteobacteria bacterium]|nr:histidine kinase [Gammaproteobacteria bacterium]